jgi:hypothetical protein
MSEPETFVARWSRLKREAGKTAEEEHLKPRTQPEAAVALATAGGPPRRESANREGADEPAFDPASLPPIESITAGTDIRDFLRAGVPAELTKAALRRVWTADPAIRDFIGIAENQWDFTDPTAIPGFGPLQASDDVGKLVAQAIGKARDTAEPLVEAPAAGDQTAGSVHRNTAPTDQRPSAAGMQDLGTPEKNPNPSMSVEPAGSEHSRVDIAVQDDQRLEIRGRSPNRRGHGSALPQ